ncbi:glycosyltransferase family 4 protein [Oleiharenicola lentus]|uniref:glycosyltransferase family 4 protein n=1 Tax=Oleiharenicola lentus TaxID=2508720 RepID=UPI003F6808CA
MNILLISPELFLADGGIARIMRLYLKALCEIAGPNDRVDSLVLNDEPTLDPRLPRYTNSRLGEHLGCARKKFRFIREIIRLDRRADVIVCGHLHHLALARLAKGFNPKVKIYLVAHGIEIWRPYSRLERGALRNAEKILAISEYTRRQVLRFAPELSPSRIVVVPNTLDPFISQRDSAAPAANHFAHPRILTVSRLSSTDTYKGIDILIEAMPLVRREFPFAQLRIVGRGDDQPRLQALAARLQIGSAVEFLGALSDEALREEYAACDIFALPSRREGFGLVYLEAMTYGKPCLGARAGGTPEVIHESVGLLVDYGNVPDTAAAISDLARQPRNSDVVRAHADSFAFPAFTERLRAALN